MKFFCCSKMNCLHIICITFYTGKQLALWDIGVYLCILWFVMFIKGVWSSFSEWNSFVTQRWIFYNIFIGNNSLFGILVYICFSSPHKVGAGLYSCCMNVSRSVFMCIYIYNDEMSFAEGKWNIQCVHKRDQRNTKMRLFLEIGSGGHSNVKGCIRLIQKFT